MGIVLLEATDTGQARERATQFITVQDTKVSETDGEFTVRAISNTKHHTVTRAVHGLERVLFLLHVEAEHVFLVIDPVSRRFPQLDVVDVGCHDLGETALVILRLGKCQEARRMHTTFIP